MKVLAAIGLFLCFSFSHIIKIEQTLNVKQKSEMESLTSGLEKSTGRAFEHKSVISYPIYVNQDGQELTIIVKNNQVYLISIELFYNQSVAK